jgi:hypothetical protein
MPPRFLCDLCFARPDIGGACPACAPAPAADTPDGFDRAPARYTATGRETIDRMRDLAHERAAGWYQNAPRALVEHLADVLFAYHCDATALKYEDRTGLKDDAEQDRKKARFYRQMAAHARGEGPDPRSERPGFVPYARPTGGAS